ncbi:MAG: hypothetical protein HY842_07855 [Bacteroidetes bacterium]|nr:hypothetical protein [Bacteroidota bacterium]
MEAIFEKQKIRFYPPHPFNPLSNPPRASRAKEINWFKIFRIRRKVRASAA